METTNLASLDWQTANYLWYVQEVLLNSADQPCHYFEFTPDYLID